MGHKWRHSKEIIFLYLQGFVFQCGGNTAFYAEGNDVMLCMVVGRKFFVYVFGQDKFNRVLTGTEVFHW